MKKYHLIKKLLLMLLLAFVSGSFLFAGCGELLDTSAEVSQNIQTVRESAQTATDTGETSAATERMQEEWTGLSYDEVSHADTLADVPGYEGRFILF